MKKHLKYLSYVIRHKLFVFIASRRVGGVSLFRALIHDWTKFLPSEWEPYVTYFYGDKKIDSNESNAAIRKFGCCESAPYGFYRKERFNKAWLYHQKRNKHHWQYWMLQNDGGEYFPLPMPLKYAHEMVADWMGAGRAIHGHWECTDWYEKNKDKIKLHPETRDIVERILRGAKTPNNQPPE
jgi:hypothetical protein